MLIRCNNCFGEYDEKLGLCPFCGYAEGEPSIDAFCLSPGTIIGDRYVIGGKVSSGGFGIVYRAWDKKLETIIAIKEYYPSGLVNRLPGENTVILVASKREREFVYGKTRFLEEARNMAKFSSHKNIVNVYHFFEENNTAYIVMEYLSGRTLSEVLQQQNVPLPYDYCVNVASEVCAALRAIHKEKILHRDVSPDNIMICNDGTVKLFDFGAARFSAGVENRVTVVVKPGFAPPEQYDKVNRQDPRTDIYALGATLYYALTGTKPEESTNRKIEDSLVEPASIDSGIPKSISTAIMRAMAVEPQYRFSDVDEFEKALLSEKEVASVQREKKKRKYRRNVGILASFAVLLSALGVFTHILRNQKESAALPDANLTMWYIETGDERVDSAKAAALDAIIDNFVSEYSNVNIELESKPADEYVNNLGMDNKPIIFESTILGESDLASTQNVKDILENQKNTYIIQDEGAVKQYPTGIIAPVVYVNTALVSLDNTESIGSILSACQDSSQMFAVKASSLEMFATLYGTDLDGFYLENAKSEFLNRNLGVLLGDNSDYFDVQDSLPGEYAVLVPSTDVATYKYGTLWSIGECDADTTTVAKAFLGYLASPLAQDYLHIQNKSGELPIEVTSTQSYFEIYNEISDFSDYLSRPFVASGADGMDELPFGNTVSIPQKLVQDLSVGIEKNQPCITFSDDNTCVLYFNMAEWMQELAATFEVYDNGAEGGVIRCDFDAQEIGDGLDHKLSYFYLCEMPNGNWEFYGESIGLTYPGQEFVAAGADHIMVSASQNNSDSAILVGEYQEGGESLNTLTVNQIGNDGTMLFDVFWHRVASIDKAHAVLQGNLAPFHYMSEDGYNETWGFVEFGNDNTAVLTLLETKLPYIEPGATEFHFVSEEEKKIQTEQATLSELLMNKDEAGWVKYSSSPNNEVYIRFKEDGTVQYWEGENIGGEITYHDHSGTYSVDGNVLNLDGYKFEFISGIGAGAAISFYINALDEDPLYLGGEYQLEPNEIYQFLVANT